MCDLRGNGPADSPFKTDHQCIPVMDAGSPCCNDNGHECHDAYCGPPWRAGWGVGGNGKCGYMNGNSNGDVVNDAVTGLTGGTRDNRFYERCFSPISAMDCNMHRAVATTAGFHVHDIPEQLTYRTQIYLTVG